MSGRVEQASRWMYRGVWGVLVRWFRVPDQPPTLPAQDGDSERRLSTVKSFQPAEGFLRYLKFIFWVVLGITDIALTIGWIAGSVALLVAGLWWVAVLIAPIALFIIIAPDVLAYVAIHLRYDTTWYVLTDRSMRIRRGIWVIRETTITFENVQNVKVMQGPVQRHFGIANVLVETAGAGGSGGGGGKGHQAGVALNQGIIEGIDNAEEVRDLILSKLRQSKSAGLGDERAEEASRDDQHPCRNVPVRAAAWAAEHVEVLREIRFEAGRLSPTPA